MNHTALFTAARLAEKSGRHGLASKLYTRSAGAPEKQRAEALYRLANLEAQTDNFVDTRRLLEEALELQPDRAAWHYRLAAILEKEGEKETAVDHYRTAVRLEPGNPTWAQRLGRCENAVRMAKAKMDDERAKSLRQQGARWQELEVLQNASRNFSNSPDWFLRLGDSLESMHRFAEAAEAFGKANDLRSGRAVNLAREGHCWRQAGFGDRADAAFNRAQACDEKYESRELGVGVFLERRGMWHEAAAQFELDCDKQPMNAELHFRAGRALERSYRWKEAASRYCEATLLRPAEARYHLRLGFVRERMNDFVAAEDCYSYGISLPSKTPQAKYWSYRLGVVREAQGKLESAIEAYLESLDTPFIKQAQPEDVNPHQDTRSSYELELLDNAKALALRSPDALHILSVTQEFERRGLWSDAVSCLEAAADRNQAFDPAIYFRLGIAYRHLGNYKASACSFRMTRIAVAPSGIDATRYEKDVTLQRHFEYAEMLENLPLRDDVIFYESFLGNQITCNPYALFRNVFEDSEYANYTHVWSITPETEIPRWMENLENVLFVERGSHLNLRYLATAKYLVNNVTFPAYFVRRDGQKYLNTWHGTPMKTLGKDVGTGVLEYRNVARNFLQATHIVTPNQHTTDVMLGRYDVDSLVTAKVAHTGYPRIDLTVGMEAGRRRDILASLGVVGDDERKVVLYAPTWRGGADFKHFDVERLTSDLQALSELDCLVLFQGHHLSASLLPSDLPVRVVTGEVNTNELLAVVDVLVTDYSSILYDFFPTRRPVVCYTYDLDEYVAERGLYFTPSELGLAEVRTTGALVDTVASALGNPNEFSTSQELVNSFCGREDGHAAERVKSFLFKDDDHWNVPRPVSNKRRFLFHHSMLPNGISSSLTNLLKSLDPLTCDVTVVVPAGVIENNEGATAVLRGLPPYVNVVADAGRQVVNIEEKWSIDYFNQWNVLASSAQRELYMGAFKREYRRLLGDAEFDVVVEFEGYSRYWTSVLAAGGGKKIIYLHSDMVAERNTRLPYLQGVFELYEHYDVLASVSPALSRLNHERLSEAVGGEPGKFVSVMNQIDPEGVRQLSNQPLDDDLVPWFSEDIPTVVTMGRLSLEKDQAKLIRAMSQVIARGLNANLVLLGDGPLRQDLEQLVADLKLNGHVYFAGQRENPFSALSAAQCFVLSSNHEGQPMVLLESMIVGTPIVATDIPGSRHVLAENLDSIVENSVEGLAGGIIRVLEGKRPVALKFDADAYSSDTRNAFLAITL